MTFEFKFPDVGEGIIEGEIVSWKIKEGDNVNADQIIAEIETDKAVVQVPCPKAGTIIKLYGKEGDTIKVGSILLTLAEEGETVPQEKTESECEGGVCKMPEITPKEPEKPKDAGTVVGTLPEYEEVKEHQYFFLKTGESIKTLSELKERISQIDNEIFSHHVTESKNDFAEWISNVLHNNELADKIAKVNTRQEILSLLSEKKSSSKVKALPTVRKLAKEKGVNLSTITPTGKQGQITKKDVENAVKPEENKPGIKITKREYDLFGYIDKIQLKGIRKTIAKNMAKFSSTTAAASFFDEADATQLFDLRQKEKGKAAEKGIKLTFLPFIVRATIKALKQHPNMNANIDDENDILTAKKYYNIGIATDTPNGLLVPVVKIAGKKTIEELAQEISRVSQLARERKLDLADMKGGTFTISNLGSFNGKHGTQIINYPEVAILLVGRIYEKPVAVNGNVEIRKVLPLSVTFDHRIIDGAEAAKFMMDLKSFLEDPGMLLNK